MGSSLPILLAARRLAPLYQIFDVLHMENKRNAFFVILL